MTPKTTVLVIDRANAETGAEVLRTGDWPQSATHLLRSWHDACSTKYFLLASDDETSDDCAALACEQFESLCEHALAFREVRHDFWPGERTSWLVRLSDNRESERFLKIVNAATVPVAGHA